MQVQDLRFVFHCTYPFTRPSFLLAKPRSSYTSLKKIVATIIRRTLLFATKSIKFNGKPEVSKQCEQK